MLLRDGAFHRLGPEWRPYLEYAAMYDGSLKK